MKLLYFVDGLGLAIKALVIVCALANQSCLVPQSVDPIGEAAHPPPHFVLGSIPTYLLAPILQLYRQGSADQGGTPACHCELELSIKQVEEDDPTVNLEARWFVDYDPTVPASVRPWANPPLPGTFNNPDTLRPLDPFRVDADALGIATNGFHVVTVIVGETAGFDSTSTTRPNKAMKAGYEAAEYSFTINVRVDQDPARPQCPSDLPSVKVCQ